MKKKNWYSAFSLADDKYIAEAHPDNIIKAKTSKVFLSLVAACACFTLIFGCLWLFIPFDTTPPDVSRYADSEYYDIIQSLNERMYELYKKPEYKNNAQKLWAELSERFDEKDKNTNDFFARPESDDSYEIHDNQVDGIAEANIIKRSDTHIYYLDKEMLRIYSIDKENSKEIGAYQVFPSYDYDEIWYKEMFLSSDFKTVTVIARFHEDTNTPSDSTVKLISLDVSDPANVVQKKELNLTGYDYVSSRSTDGNILLFTEYSFYLPCIDFSDVRTFVPQIDEGDGPYTIPAGKIVSSKNSSRSSYTIALMLNEETLEIKDIAACRFSDKEIYVSENNIYLTDTFADKKENDDGSITTDSLSEIFCFSYDSDSFEFKGSATVRGYLNNQWSMDEYNNVLRVFTTSAINNSSKTGSYYDYVDVDRNACLYCIDLSTFEIIASVIDFAPPDERIFSVRFDKEKAYACTAIGTSDPVYFFDLSDLNNITYTDTGTIEGFSTSLINFGNGYLVGIGRGEEWSFKIEVYEEAEGSVRSVCTYKIDTGYFSTDYKSYYIDRENQLIGLGLWDIWHRYILIRFDGEQIVELINMPFYDSEYEDLRGFYLDGYMYMIGHEEINVKKVFD